ncbi:MAG: VWA domain-containing protein [Polyangiaceae bacterium]|nr:VWA domain-containing protein [Polyangiaceae bacterium]
MNPTPTEDAKFEANGAQNHDQTEADSGVWGGVACRPSVSKRALRSRKRTLVVGQLGFLLSVLGSTSCSSDNPIEVADAPHVVPAATAELTSQEIPATREGSEAGEAGHTSVDFRARNEAGEPREMRLVDETLAATIDDGYVTAKIARVFENPTSEKLEGTFLVSAGENGNVSGFEYWNGTEKIVGEVFEKEAARKIYEETTGMKNDPGLGEREGEGSFSFRVYPIEPSEKKRVEVVTEGYARNVGGIHHVSLPLGAGSHQTSQKPVRVTFTTQPHSLGSPTHDVRWLRDDAKTMVAEFIPKVGPERATELLFSYEVDPKPFVPEVTSYASPGEDAYVRVHLQGPTRTKGGEEKPKDVTIVIDVSGSMSGEPLEQAKIAAKKLVDLLGESDRVNVIAFDDKVEALAAAPFGNAKGTNSKSDARAYIDRLKSRGGTDIAIAISKALSSQNHDDRRKIVLFFTDGESDRQAALNATKSNPDRAQVFTIGFGGGVDKALLTSIAEASHGRFSYVDRASSIPVVTTKVLSQLSKPALSNVAIDFGGARVHHMYPATLPDLFEGDEITVLARMEGRGGYKVKVTGDTAGGKRGYESSFVVADSNAHPGVGRTWATYRANELEQDLAKLTEESGRPGLEAELVDLGMAYNLVTSRTSFLAIPESAIPPELRENMRGMRQKRAELLARSKDAIQLSRSLMPPGDPTLFVRAPKEAKEVIASFPFGLELPLSYDPSLEKWTARFLVPDNVKDGKYEIRVRVTMPSGETSIDTVEYVIDSNAPLLHAETEGDSIEVRSIEPLADVRGTIGKEAVVFEPLDRDGTTVWRGTFTQKGFSNPGELRLVASDLARNEMLVSAKVGEASVGSPDLPTRSPLELKILPSERSKASAHSVTIRPPVTAMHDGELYEGTFNDGLFLASHREQGAYAGPKHINQLLSTSRGLFVAASEGLFHLEDGKLVQDTRIERRGINGLAVVGDSLWISSPSCVYRLQLDKPSKPAKAFWTPAGSVSVQGVVALKDQIFFPTEDRGMVNWDGHTFGAHDAVSGLPTSWFVSAEVNENGNLVGQTLAHGDYVWDGKRFVQVSRDGAK